MPSHSSRGRKSTFIRQSGICHYCGSIADWKDWTIDHKIPISRCLEFSISRYNGNTTGCCFNCNHAKGNMTDLEFIATDYLTPERRKTLGCKSAPTSWREWKKAFETRTHNQKLNLASLFV